MSNVAQYVEFSGVYSVTQIALSQVAQDSSADNIGTQIYSIESSRSGLGVVTRGAG